MEVDGAMTDEQRPQKATKAERIQEAFSNGFNGTKQEAIDIINKILDENT